MKRYWTDTGRLQGKYGEIQHLVPFEGKSDLLPVELLRIAGNIYYDHYNNGGCNLRLEHFREDARFLASHSSLIEPYAKSLGIRRWNIRLSRFFYRRCPETWIERVMDGVIAYCHANVSEHLRVAEPTP